MSRRFGRLAAAFVLSCAAYAVPAYADVTIGTPSIGGNCYPFGCGYTGEYQQVYGSAAFGGPITINNVQFFPSASWPLNDNTGSFTLTFYLTSRPVDGLSTNPTANETTLLSSFGTFVPGTSYSFTGNAFTYDPSLGNLLLDITTTGAPGDSNILYYSSLSGHDMSNVYRSGGTGTLTAGTNGLVHAILNRQQRGPGAIDLGDDAARLRRCRGVDASEAGARSPGADRVNPIADTASREHFA